VQKRVEENSRLLKYMLIAAAAYAISGLSVHGLRGDTWDLALFARALFGLPFAINGLSTMRYRLADLLAPALIIRSVLAVSFLGVLYYALQTISPGNAFALVSMRPIWVAAICLLIGQNKVKAVFWPLAMMGTFGVALMEGSHLTGSLGFIAIAAALGMLGAGSTIAINYCHKYSEKLMTFHYTFLMLIVSIILVSTSGDASKIGILISWKSLFLLVAMGMTGNMYTLFSIKSVKLAGAEAGSLIVLLTTVFAYVASHLIWKNSFSVSEFIGIALTLVSCVSVIGCGGVMRKTTANH
jgi:drug/metabolite transporter (DMT)-like permease